LTDGEIADVVRTIFPTRPYDIEQAFQLRMPIYEETAAYGHMGREPEVKTKTFRHANGKDFSVEVTLFPWEKLDRVEAVREAFGL